MRQIIDPDVRILESHSLILQGEYGEEGREWAGSPFAWIKTRPSRQIGVIGEKLVAGFLAAKGFDVTRSPDPEADRVINGTRAEIKFSTLWQAGFYNFQQLRDQNYGFVVCLGVSPFDAHCWVISKAELMQQWRAGAGVQAQHGGQAGRDTAWLSVTPGREPTWLRACGGRLAQAAARVTLLSGRKPLP